ncbi:MAG: hypothetical protein ABSE44_01955, partial [Candidatus Sulfotelmatobacter sp.]
LLRSYGNNPHLGVATQQEAALDSVAVTFVHGKNEDIWPSLLDCLGEVILVPNIPDQLDVGLVGDGGHYEFPHQTGLVCDEDAGSFHVVSPTLNVSAEYPSYGSYPQGSKENYESGLSHSDVWSKCRSTNAVARAVRKQYQLVLRFGTTPFGESMLSS